MGRRSFLILLLSGCVGTPPSGALTSEVSSPTALRPVGVYAHLNISKVIHGDGYNTQAKLCTLYEELLSNQAIAGLVIGFGWSDLAPGQDPPYQWQGAPGCANPVYSGTNAPATPGSAINGAFDLAKFHNKTIHLAVSPGFHTPDWLITDLKSCDGWFDGSPVDSDCGTVTFTGYPEERAGDGTSLPLPWNTNYQTVWGNFVGQLATNFGPSSPYGSTLVAVSIAGPTGASPEMILPTDKNTTPTPQPSPTYVNPNVVWTTLFQHQLPAGEQSSDKVFVLAWKKAIDQFNTAFQGVTLILAPDNGEQLPDFDSAAPSPNPLLDIECAHDKSMSCGAVSTVMDAFTKVTGSNNALATETGGMTASSSVLSNTGDVGLPGVKALTDPNAAHPILGGAQFDHAVTDGTTAGYTCSPSPSPYQFIQIEGCPQGVAQNGDQCPCKGLTPEQAIYNVMSAFFSGTPAACQFPYQGTAPTTSTPLSYLTVGYEDVLYAWHTQRTCSPVGPAQTPVSAQYLLLLANWALMQQSMGDSPYPSPSPVDVGCAQLAACQF